MTRLTARLRKNGQLEVQGLEAFVRSIIGKFSRVPGTRPAAAKAKSADPVLAQLLTHLSRHPKRSGLLRAGKQKDQLLRSLVPLYLSRKGELHLTSGAISRFWAYHGVKYAPPNAAKALREHVGYARLDAKARQITPNGVRYVEAALASAKHQRAA
jgi:hypothetical protein